jgi:hypothetical protein
MIVIHQYAIVNKIFADYMLGLFGDIGAGARRSYSQLVRNNLDKINDRGSELNRLNWKQIHERKYDGGKEQIMLLCYLRGEYDPN